MRRILALAALALAIAAPLQAQQTVNLRDADIRAYIQDVSRATGRTFIIDPRVQGKVSVVSERPLGRTEYFELFLATLRANGFAAAPGPGGALRIQPADVSVQTPSARGGADSFVTEVIRLTSIDAQSAAETLRPMISRAGQINANRNGNAIIIADYADNVRRIRALVAQIDRDRAATRTITLKNAGAREIAATLTQLAGNRDGGTAQVNIVPVDSSNAIALRGDPAVVARLADVAVELDKRAAAGSDIRVIFLNYADADKIMPVLQQLVGQSATVSASGSGKPGETSTSTATASAPTGAAGQAIIGRGQAVIARFEGANAIVIAAPSDVQRQLGEVVRQLDTRREQVLVEAIIAEISDTTSKRLGVQFLIAGTEGSSIPFALTNYSNSAPNILAIAGAIASEGGIVAGSDALRNAAAASLSGSTGGTGGFADRLGSNAVFGVIINALRADTTSNLLSTPSVMTLDNQQAKILVGQEIPISTGEALSNNFDNAFRTIQRQNVGIQLEVRPQINAGGAIKLFLRQEVSSIAGPVSTSSSELVLNKREIETTVTVDDGQIIALGGLIDENERRTIEKTPILGDIPLLGELFKSRSRNRGKTNLMVFIRPTIIRSAADAQRISAQRYDYMREAQTGGDAKVDASLDALVRDYLKANPPVDPGSPAPPSSPPKP